MNPPASAGSRRDAVPIPPLKSKHAMPVPAPTHPSATGPEAASESAAATSSSDNGKDSTSDSHESSHSLTTGMTSPAPVRSRPAIQRTVAS